MEKKRIAYFPNEYNEKERNFVYLENCVVAHTTEKDLNYTPVSRVIDTLRLIEFTWGLRLNRPHDFKVAKRILLNSILYN